MAIIWLAPITIKPKQIIKNDVPILVEYQTKNLILAVPNVQAACAPSCRIRVCVDWDPTPCGSNPWDIGCCLAYADECDPDCDAGGGGGNQPPTISHILTCTQLGSNDWCIGTLSLDLTASDPQNAQIVISGEVDGIAFACPTGNVTCSVPLGDGQGTLTYRVDSSTGLSDSDTTSYKKDSATPQINGSIAGTNGLNNWYVSSSTVSASSNDSTSGILTFEMNVDNTGWVNYSNTTFNDGIHTIQYRAIDNAGNSTETSIQEIKVDTVTPVINISITGTSGLSNWYTSNVILSATSNDITSGVSSFEINVNNTGWVNYVETTLTDGIHSVQYRATDNAGNTYTTVEQQIKVDTTTPSLTIATNGTKGMNNWYVTATTITPTATDVTSGIVTIEYSLNNGAFSTYTTPVQFMDGISTYQFRIIDHAGNTTLTPNQTVKVDTISPTVNKDKNIKLGDELDYTLSDATSGLWIQRVVIEDEDEKYKKIVWLDTISGNEVANSILWDGVFADGTQAPAGEYYITFKISDQAGNETFHLTEVQVSALSFLIPIAPFTPPTTNTELPSNEITSDEDEQSFGNENNGNPTTETTSESSGGEAGFAGLNAQVGAISSSSNLFNFGNEITSTTTTNSNILWGAVAAAALGATLAEWQRQREQPRGTSKGARAKYEAMLKQKRIVGESQALLDKNRAEQKNKSDEQRNRLLRLNEEKPNVDMQKVNQLLQEKAYQDFRKGEVVSVQSGNVGGSKPLYAPLPQQEKSWLSNIPFFGSSLDKTYSDINSIVQDNSTSKIEKVENLMAWTIWNNPIFQATTKIEPIKNFYQSYTAILGDSLRSIADPERNPRTATFHQQFWGGIGAWQGVFEMRQEAKDYTWNALKEGDWQNAVRGTSALIQQNIVATKSSLWFAGMATWAAVTTPIRIFTHDIPEFRDAGRERQEGKDRFWDVLFTATNLMGDVTGTYGMAKPVGLAESANSWLSRNLLGRDLPVIPTKFVSYYLKDIFNGGANRNLLNNLVESTYSTPSQIMVNALKFQNFYQRMVQMSESVQISVPRVKPIQVSADLDVIYQMAAEAEPELRNIITDLANRTNGQAQFSNGLKELKTALGKIAGDYKGDASRITDITRGRVVYESLDELYDGLKMLSDDGVIEYMKDRFLNPADSGYRDILTNIKLSNGHVGELRLELKELSEFAKLEHLLYEQKRVIIQTAKAENRFLTQEEVSEINNIESITQHSYSEIWESIIKSFK